jgi:signal transduction histidine kinase
MLRDLDQMSEMVHGALSFLRDGEGVRSRALVDLASLLQTVCDEWADAGDAVSYEGPDRLAGHVHATELRRAVENLVENAIKHGRTRVTVRLRASAPQEVEIDVIDEGPGIPGERKRAMLEPFTRGDDARSMNEASPGFGLGLAIARSAAEAHGGDLVLRDGSPCGLIATLRIGIGPDPDRVPEDPEPLTRRGSGS